MRPKKPYMILTPDDVAAAVHEVLAHGWGQVRVVITEHYIKVVEPTKTLQGHKPD